MERSFLRQLELKQARSRWQWCYWVAYANAVFATMTAFVLEDESGTMVFGIDPLYTPFVLIWALVLAALAWGIHKKVSIVCLVILLCVVVLGIVMMIVDQDSPKDLFMACLVAFFLIRGIVGVRELKKAFRENKKEVSEQAHPASSEPAGGPADADV